MDRGLVFECVTCIYCYFSALFKLPDPEANIYIQSLLNFPMWGAHRHSKSPPHPVAPPPPPPPLGHNTDSCIRLCQIWILRLIINTTEIENRVIVAFLLVCILLVFYSLLLDKFQICRSKSLLFQLFSPFSRTLQVAIAGS